MERSDKWTSSDKWKDQTHGKIRQMERSDK